jgi:hypothetical protein
MRSTLVLVALATGCLDYDEGSSSDASRQGDLAMRVDLDASSLIDLSNPTVCLPSAPDAGQGSFNYFSFASQYAANGKSSVAVPAGIVPADTGVAFAWSRGADFEFGPGFTPVATGGTDLYVSVATTTNTTSGSMLDIVGSSMPYFVQIVFYAPIHCVQDAFVTSQSEHVDVAYPQASAPTIDVVFFAQVASDCSFTPDGAFNPIVTDSSSSSHTGVISAVYEHLSSAGESATLSAPTSCTAPGETFDLATLQLVP